MGSSLESRLLHVGGSRGAGSSVKTERNNILSLAGSMVASAVASETRVVDAGFV
jgi:hypothetical protein